MAPTVRAYIRVSTLDQQDSGHGLAALREAVRREYEYRWQPAGFVSAPVYEDPAVSAAKPFRSRPAGLRLSNDLARGDVALFPKLDRGFRNTIDLLTTVRGWHERGVRVVFLDLNVDTASPTGWMIMGILGHVAEFERERGRERTREAVRAAQRRGALVGMPPWGCRVRGPKGKRYYEAAPRLLEVGKKIVEWKLRGCGWEAIRLHLIDSATWRPAAWAGPRANELTGRAWRACDITRAYTYTLRLLRWIETGKVKLPKESASEKPD